MDAAKIAAAAPAQRCPRTCVPPVRRRRQPPPCSWVGDRPPQTRRPGFGRT